MAGEASAEALVDFLVVDFLAVDAGAAAIGSSFFWALSLLQELRNASIATAVINVKTVVFIGLVKLNDRENVDPAGAEQARKFVLLAFLICKSSVVIQP